MGSDNIQEPDNVSLPLKSIHWMSSEKHTNKSTPAYIKVPGTFYLTETKCKLTEIKGN